MAQPGDTVKVITSEKETIEGILLPSFEPGVILLKLKNGYNLGFQEKEVAMLVMKPAEKPHCHSSNYHSSSPLFHQKSLPTIAILHTGGTIASKVDYQTGGVYAGFAAEDFLQLFPEITNIANIRTRHVANLMSEDIRFSHYQLLAKAIQEEIAEGCAGIIIGHGTDTLAITSAALAFMFENLPLPVILVGAQRSSDRGSTDAALNLLSAATFITKADFAGVAVCMHASSNDDLCHILPATKTRKMHTSRRDAFKAINDEPLATVHYSTQEVTFHKPYLKKSGVSGKLSCKSPMEEKVAVLKTFPNMSPLFLQALVTSRYKGLILEGTGIGQAPTNILENLPNYEALKSFIQQGGLVVLTSQCLYGRVHPDIYANCRRLKEIGVIFGEDMLAETAYVKLAWLLGNYPLEKARELIGVNLRGEISERISYSEKISDWK